MPDLVVGETEHPFYFGEGAALFGVLHRPDTGLARGPGWVLCDAFGVERNNSHRLMVEWARELCRHGYPVLRFDYRGTGDSAGTFDQFTVDDHLKDILAAMGETKRLTGCGCGGLLGLRLGASLAALAAGRVGGVERLALWEPIVDGRAYRDQLLRSTLASELVAGGARHHSREELRDELSAGGCVHVDGFPLTAAMYESLAAVEPASLGRGAVRDALVVQVDAVPGHPTRRTMEELCTAICAGGRGHLESAAAPIAWLRTKQFQWRPPELFGKTAAWIERISGPSPGPFTLPAVEPRPKEAIRTTAHGRVVEKPVSFTVEGQQVWGILHRPEGPASDKPGVVLLAAGETCRSSIFYPGLARRLAAAGWPVLRFDPRGLGDSRGQIEGASLAEVFVQIQGGRLVPEAAAAVGFLTGELGTASCILTGLCGGAVTAVYAAALDRRVAAIAPIELRLLWDRVPEVGGSQDGWRQLPWRERLSVWRGGLPLLNARRALHWLRAQVRSLRLAAGGLRRRGSGNQCGRDGWFIEKLGEEANLRVLDALKRTFDRGIPVLCIFADGRHRNHLESALPGLLPVESTARARPSVQSLEGADHNFVMPGCPERLAEALLAWLDSPEHPWAKPPCKDDAMATTPLETGRRCGSGRMHRVPRHAGRKTMTSALSKFLVQHREVIERRAHDVFFARSAPMPAESELLRGIPVFMEQLIETLNRGHEVDGEVDDGEIAKTAAEYGQRLFGLGFTVSELVHGYGSVCEVLTKLAGEVGHDIATSDFAVFNRVLDVAIAESVTAHERAHAAEATEKESERIGALAHELKNALSTATLSLGIIKKGTVGTRGPTADVLDRSLARMGVLIDRSLTAVRLQIDPTPVLERFRLADVLDQIGAMTRREVESRNLEFSIEIDRDLEIKTDQQFFISIMSNLVTNALKYTRTGGRVSLRGRCTDGRLAIEVEDQCGGLPPGKIDELFSPFVREAHQHPGVGLGLSIAMRAIKALNGAIHVRDLPGKGCIFMAELPAVCVLPGNVRRSAP